MQKNLDDVLRAVPMDMSDNLEQIGVSKVTPSETPKAASPPAAEQQKQKECECIFFFSFYQRANYYLGQIKKIAC